jgi:hypothetical protein
MEFDWGIWGVDLWTQNTKGAPQANPHRVGLDLSNTLKRHVLMKFMPLPAQADMVHAHRSHASQHRWQQNPRHTKGHSEEKGNKIQAKEFKGRERMFTTAA